MSRVATPATANQWVERAQGRTFKHLREEVRVAEMCARYGGWSEEMTAPPDEQDLALYHDLERSILSGAWLEGGASAGGGSEGVQISGAPSGAEPANDVQGGDAVQISAPEVLGERAVGLRLVSPRRRARREAARRAAGQRPDLDHRPRAHPRGSWANKRELG